MNNASGPAEAGATGKHADRAAPWNRGKLISQKPPLKLREVWAIRIRLQIQGEHANRWGVIRRPLPSAYNRHSRGGTHDGVGGRRPRACRSARPCARPGTAAPWLCSSASAAFSPSVKL